MPRPIRFHRGRADWRALPVVPRPQFIITEMKFRRLTSVASVPVHILIKRLSSVRLTSPASGATSTILLLESFERLTALPVVPRPRFHYQRVEFFEINELCKWRQAHNLLPRRLAPWHGQVLPVVRRPQGRSRGWADSAVAAFLTILWTFAGTVLIEQIWVMILAYIQKLWWVSALGLYCEHAKARSSPS